MSTRNTNNQKNSRLNRNSLRNSKTLRKLSKKLSRKLSLKKNVNTSRYSFATNTYKNHHENLNACEKIILEDLATRFARNELDVEVEHFDKAGVINIKGEEQLYYTRNAKNESSIDMHFMDPAAKFAYLNSPIISFDKNNNKVSHYSNIKAGDKILIWSILDEYGTSEHLAAQIITKTNKYFSFGFLPSESKPGLFHKITRSSVIVTPDSLFERKLIQHLFNDRGYETVKLIAASILTERTKNKLIDEFENITNIESGNYSYNVKQKLLSKYSLNQKILNLNKLNNSLITLKFRTIHGHIDNEKHKNMLNSDEQNLLSDISSKTFNSVYYYLSGDESIPYCLLSSKRETNHKKQANCSSFLVSLFEDVIKCSGFFSYIAIDPEHCKQRERSEVLRCTKKNNANSPKAKASETNSIV